MLAFMIALATPAPLAPLDFLVGHCWRGSLDPARQDTHCFTRHGEQVRDRHEVVEASKRVYSGETVYRWDAAAGVIRYSYSNPGMEVSDGTVRADGRDLDFGTSTIRSDGGSATAATRWNRVGDDAYDAVSSADRNVGVPPRTRYRRID